MSMMVSTRLPDDVGEAMQAFQDVTGWSRSAVIETAVAEWLRLQRHPGIRFVEWPYGRRVAALVNGPEVWTVAEAWLDHEPDARTDKAMTEATGLTSQEVNAALSYYCEFTDEINGQVDVIHAEQERQDALWARHQNGHADR